MSKRRTFGSEAASAVRRIAFDGKPIVDAKADFTLVVRTSDVVAAKGREKDAANCVLAKACARQVGASIVAFFRQVAYLEMPDAKGVRKVVRYKLDADAVAIVAAFDRGKAVSGEVSITLKAPRPSEKLDVVLEKNRRLRAAQRHAILSGQILERGGKKGPSTHKARIVDLDVRNGSGLIHNIVKKAKT